jgi:hypothetical protein
VLLYIEPEASPAESVSPDNDTNCTESQGACDSELYSDLDMCMEDALDPPHVIDFDSDVDLEWDRDDVDEEDTEEDDKNEEDEEEEVL